MVLNRFIYTIFDRFNSLFNFKSLENEIFIVENSIKQLSGHLIIAGYSIDKTSLKAINIQNLDYQKIKKITLLINRSNFNPLFIKILNAFAQDLSDFNINLEIKFATSVIPFDLYIFNKWSPVFFIMRNSIETNQIVIKRSINPIIRKNITEAIRTAEDISSIRGEEIYYIKYNKIYQIRERGFCPGLEEKIFSAIFQWEKSDYHDIKALIDIFEYVIRHFIVIRLKPVSRNDWFTKYVMTLFNPRTQQNIINRFQDNLFGCTSLDQHPFPVEYLVCENYKLILNSPTNSAPFSDYQSQDTESILLKEYVDAIIAARNPPFHSRHRNITTDLHAETIIKIIIVLKWLCILEPKLTQLNYEIGEIDPLISQL
jgi:hypothetical protein